MCCKKCNDTGVTTAEPQKKQMIGGNLVEYPIMKLCDCQIIKKEQKIRIRILHKKKKKFDYYD